MGLGKVAREQQIAVFGERGSGKTVLLSSFYGGAQEPEFQKTSLFDVVADDTSDGNRLHQNYLGMKKTASLPMSNQLKATSYSFSVKRRKVPGSKAKNAKQVEDLRLIWHDYPGEWFEQDPNGPVEAARRVETFRSLLTSDVALLLVDAQRLMDNSGEEERYLKALFTNLKNGLLKLRDDLLEDGKPLVMFPRVWVVALSKSDLLPDFDVCELRDLIVEKAAGELSELRTVLGGFIQAPDALSVGEDFVLLSSAKFEPGSIEVTKRIGLDLILPMAAMLPLSRTIGWILAMKKGGEVANHLLSTVTPLVLLITTKIKLPGPLKFVVALIGPSLADFMAKLTNDKLDEFNRDAKDKHDYVSIMMTNFGLDLERGEKDQVLLRSLK
ncbi:ATP/GTP-binding protein [Mycetocola sp. 2940]|uniref:TRAFAC clade GTPase domain-containing protein n=1 Tax=Mycetocola sp. 2940 TaxID=3156452 RepID=UPI003399CAB0